MSLFPVVFVPAGLFQSSQDPPPPIGNFFVPHAQNHFFSVSLRPICDPPHGAVLVYVGPDVLPFFSSWAALSHHFSRLYLSHCCALLNQLDSPRSSPPNPLTGNSLFDYGGLLLSLPVIILPPGLDHFFPWVQTGFLKFVHHTPLVLFFSPKPLPFL